MSRSPDHAERYAVAAMHDHARKLRSIAERLAGGTLDYYDLVDLTDVQMDMQRQISRLRNAGFTGGSASTAVMDAGSGCTAEAAHAEHDNWVARREAERIQDAEMAASTMSAWRQS